MLKNRKERSSLSSSFKDGKELLFIVHNAEDIFSTLVTFRSIAENSTSKLIIHTFFTFNVAPEIKAEYKKIGSVNVIVLVNELKNCGEYKGRLNILLKILLNWQGKEHVLYISSSCLALSDFSSFPSIPDNRIICSRFNAGILNFDTNVIAFNVPLFKKQFSDYPPEKKITDDMWFAMMYKYNENLPANFVYYAEEYKRTTPQILQNVKFICYKNIKPWQKLDIPFGFMWWKQARNSVFYEKILQQCSLNEKFLTNKSKLDFTCLLESWSGTMQSLMKAYLKEAFLYLFTFGKSAQVHKKKLSLIVQKISDEVKK